MKRIITIVVTAFIIISCATTAPLWTTIGRDGVYVNVCTDTLTTTQLNSMMEQRNINYYAWPRSTYTGRDTITQYTRVAGDSIFSITISTAHKDTCVYNVRYFKEIVNEGNDKK